MVLTMKFESKEPTHRALSSHGDSFEDLVTMDALVTTYSQRNIMRIVIISASERRLGLFLCLFVSIIECFLTVSLKNLQKSSAI